MEKVLILVSLNCDIKSETTDESTPPERNEPTETSETILDSTDLRSKFSVIFFALKKTMILCFFFE